LGASSSEEAAKWIRTLQDSAMKVLLCYLNEWMVFSLYEAYFIVFFFFFRSPQLQQRI